MRTWIQSLSLVLKVTYHYISCNNIIPILLEAVMEKGWVLAGQPACPNQWAPGFSSEEWTTSEEWHPICPGWGIHALTSACSPMHVHIPTHIKSHHNTYIQKIMQRNVTHIFGSLMVFVCFYQQIHSFWLFVPRIYIIKTLSLKTVSPSGPMQEFSR